MGLLWGGSRSTKPCVFPCKVAAGGDGGQLVCAAVAVHSFWCVIGSLMVFCNAWFAGVFESVVAGRTVMGA